MVIPQSMTLLSLYQIIFVFTFISFILQRTHLLISLLCLEGIILSLVLIIPGALTYSNIFSASIYAVIILTIGACEARLGLSLIVKLSRASGSDILKSITLNKC